MSRYSEFVNLIEAENSVETLRSLQTVIHERIDQLSRAVIYRLRPGDRVRYIGTKYQLGLVPGRSEGTVRRINRTRVLVNWDNNAYGDINIPASLFEVVRPPAAAVGQERPQEPPGRAEELTPQRVSREAEAERAAEALRSADQDLLALLEDAG